MRDKEAVIEVDFKKNDLLTKQAIDLLKDRYLLPNENPQDLFKRVAIRYSDDNNHANRIYTYLSNQWFMAATPILANGGAGTRGLPISCFINEVTDTMKGINDIWYENAFLASSGGGIGTFWGNVRSVGEEVSNVGKSSGIIPFIKVQDSMTLAVSQGALRRGSAAIYLDIDHPEILEFIDIRKKSGGDPNRKSLNINHGVIISDKFMEAVRDGKEWNLLSPNTKDIIETVQARDLWQRILITRVELGEPYIIFKDNVNKQRCQLYNRLDFIVNTSNLCTEITLKTGADHLDNIRTAVCCLSSVNIVHFDKWKKDKTFIKDIYIFLDNVIQDFIDNAPPEMKNAIYSAQRERSVGLGVLGFHTLLQKKMIAFGSDKAQTLNKQIFNHIKTESVKANKELAKERGPCLDSKENPGRDKVRFANQTAIAPTASISYICNASPSIDPITANIFQSKTLSGTHIIKNKVLEELLIKKELNTEKIWSSIIGHSGSVQHLSELSLQEKEVFKTAFEISQDWIIELAGARQKYLDQSQPVNLFLSATISKQELHSLHFSAWQKQLKSLYYVRSLSIQRPDNLYLSKENKTSSDHKDSQSGLNVKCEINDETGSKSCCE